MQIVQLQSLPPARCTPPPFDHVSGINVECQANEATSSNCRRRETSPKAQYGNAAGNKKNAVFNVNYTTVTTRQHEEGLGRGVGKEGSNGPRSSSYKCKFSI